MRAADYAAESVAVWTALGDAWEAAHARLALGQILEYQTDYERAIPLLEEVGQGVGRAGGPRPRRRGHFVPGAGRAGS